MLVARSATPVASRGAILALGCHDSPKCAVVGRGNLVRGHAVWLPASLASLSEHGALRQHRNAARLAGQDRMGLRPFDVSATSPCAFRTLLRLWSRIPVAGRRYQLDAGLSARRPAFLAGSPTIDSRLGTIHRAAGQSRRWRRRLQLALDERGRNGRLEADL